MLLYTIFERIQMNRIVNFKGKRAKRHACASSNICDQKNAVILLNVISAIKQKAIILMKRNSNSNVVLSTNRIKIKNKKSVMQKCRIFCYVNSKSINTKCMDHFYILIWEKYWGKGGLLYKNKSPIDAMVHPWSMQNWTTAVP
jgi:hypothetical protein